MVLGKCMYVHCSFQLKKSIKKKRHLFRFQIFIFDKLQIAHISNLFDEKIKENETLIPAVDDQHIMILLILIYFIYLIKNIFIN